MGLGTGWSTTWTFFDGDWHEGNIPLMGPRTHGAWLGSCVFDGARAFEGVTPDLDLHMARINRSAEAMGLNAEVPTERWISLTHDGLKRFGPKPELYIRPMVWGTQGGAAAVAADPASTQWCLALYESPMRAPQGFSITLSPFRRPTPESALLDAKFGGLYPQSARAAREARARGFDNCLVLDMLGHVAELATANVFLAKDGVVFTPAANGTYLAGITRARIIGLLRADGVEVVEASLCYADFQAADEIFSTGNYTKVLPINRIDDRPLPAGPLYEKARALYWDFAHGR
jgi:branched-chain amino acid aminotransferase